MRNKFLMAIAVVFALATGATAQQKIGYTNIDYILVQLPEAKQIETELKATQSQYDNLLQQKSKDFDTKYKDYEASMKAGSLSDVLRADREKELQNLQSSIQEFQKNSQSSLQKKQDQLLQPVLEKIQKNINDVAKENGYAFILNSDAGRGTAAILLVAPEDANISDLVLKKMGVTPKPATPAATPAATVPKK